MSHSEPRKHWTRMTLAERDAARRARDAAELECVKAQRAAAAEVKRKAAAQLRAKARAHQAKAEAIEKAREAEQAARDAARAAAKRVRDVAKRAKLKQAKAQPVEVLPEVDCEPVRDDWGEEGDVALPWH